MRLFRASPVAGLFVAGLIVLAPHVATAATDQDAVKMSVRYDESELNTAQGINAVYTRLKGAARHVCLPLQSRELSRQAAWQNCYTMALANAVTQVNREAVTALHQRATRNERAS